MIVNFQSEITVIANLSIVCPIIWHWLVVCESRLNAAGFLYVTLLRLLECNRPQCKNWQQSIGRLPTGGVANIHGM